MKNLTHRASAGSFCKVYATIICLLFFGIYQTASANKSQLILSGKLQYSTDSEIVIISYDGLFRQLISVVEGSFHDTIDIQAGYYKLGFKSEYADLFLQPGGDIHVEIDMKSFDESIKYSGKGAPENNFISQSYLRYESAEKQLKKWDEITEEEYVKFLDDYTRVEMEALNSCSECSGFFKELQTKHFKVKRSLGLKQFPFLKAMFSGSMEPITLSEKYPDPFEGINLNETDMLMVPGYTDLVLAHIDPQVKNLVVTDSPRDYGVTILEVAKTNIPNEQIKERLAYETFKRYIDHSAQKQKFYKLAISMVNHAIYVDVINKSYGKWTSLKKGINVPEFEFADSNGDKFKLTDFKGKYVLIDIWATWCMPCLAEIPAFNELHDKFKDSDIVFVGLAWQDDKDKWLKKLEADKLKGIQLFADNSNHDFFKTLIVNSIPRYILLDKEGKLLEHHAPRPSSGKLEEVLDGLLMN